MENTQLNQIQYPHIVGIDISKMSTFNAERNKLLNREVAVLKRGTPYVEKIVK